MASRKKKQDTLISQHCILQKVSNPEYKWKKNEIVRIFFYYQYSFFFIAHVFSAVD